MTKAASADTVVGHLLRDLAPQVLGGLARRYGDFPDAEDAVQEALIAAASQWPTDGIPNNPRGWLYRVAVRRLTDQLRSETARRRREQDVAREHPVAELPVSPFEEDLDMQGDDSLALVFMCCHPSLTPPSAVALTLRAVGGLTTAEIAGAFLVPEATVAQRISRAKQSIRSSRIPFSPPLAAERTDRLQSVLQILYLIFNEGYASTSGPSVHRTDLSDEAIRLVRGVHALLPDEGEVAGLLALMLLTDARRAARTGPGGELIPLDEQDRSKWDRRLIAEGIALVVAAMRHGIVGSYQLQAAIAAVHGQAPSVDQTDWAQILALYGLLERMTDNPMVSLNRAIAVAMVDGPAAGLSLLETLDTDPRLAGHYRLDAVRGHLFERAGNRVRAAHHYQAAAQGTKNMAERHYLITKLTRLTQEDA